MTPTSMSTALVRAFITQSGVTRELECELALYSDAIHRWGQFNSGILDGIAQLDFKQASKFVEYCKNIRVELCKMGLIAPPRVHFQDVQTKIAHLADDLLF